MLYGRYFVAATNASEKKKNYETMFYVRMLEYNHKTHEKKLCLDISFDGHGLQV